MVMLISDAKEMIARNEKGLATLRNIAARMAEKGEVCNISGHEAIFEMQKELSRFGAFYYYEGARDADFWETVGKEKEVFANQMKAVKSAALQSFERASEKSISRNFGGA